MDQFTQNLLKSLNMESYIPKFKENGICEENVFSLTNEKAKFLILRFGDRVKLLTAINKLSGKPLTEIPVTGYELPTNDIKLNNKDSVVTSSVVPSKNEDKIVDCDVSVVILPVSLLNEYCQKCKIVPKYNIIKNDFANGTKRFVCTVEVNSWKASGYSGTKREAKSRAAAAMIKKLQVNDFENKILEQIKKHKKENDNVITHSLNDQNPVGLLQEVCARMKIMFPTYECALVQMDPLNRVFECVCKVWALDLVSTGTGRTKQLAKHDAARNILKKIPNTLIYKKK